MPLNGKLVIHYVSYLFQHQGFSQCYLHLHRASRLFFIGYLSPTFQNFVTLIPTHGFEALKKKNLYKPHVPILRV